MDMKVHMLYEQMNKRGLFCDHADCSNLLASLGEHNIDVDFTEDRILMNGKEFRYEDLIQKACELNHCDLMDSKDRITVCDCNTYFSNLKNYLNYHRRDMIFTKLYQQTVFHQQLQQRLTQARNKSRVL